MQEVYNNQTKATFRWTSFNFPVYILLSDTLLLLALFLLGVT